MGKEEGKEEERMEWIQICLCQLHKEESFILHIRVDGLGVLLHSNEKVIGTRHSSR